MTQAIKNTIRAIASEHKTPWYPADVRPARDGIYEIRFDPSDPTAFRVWSGGRWCHDSGKDSLFGRGAVGCFEQWRGLKAPHNGEAA